MSADTHPGDVESLWVTAWSDALAEMEMGVAEANAMLVAGREPVAPSPWSAPVDLGPLPEQLRERAVTLLESQLEVAQRLAEGATLSRKHAKVAQAMRTAEPPRPVYLDVAS